MSFVKLFVKQYNRIFNKEISSDVTEQEFLDELEQMPTFENQKQAIETNNKELIDLTDKVGSLENTISELKQEREDSKTILEDLQNDIELLAKQFNEFKIESVATTPVIDSSIKTSGAKDKKQDENELEFDFNSVMDTVSEL